jgi:hypothetical protein
MGITQDINEDGKYKRKDLHVWEEYGFWYACISGLTYDGLYFESEDMGPMPSLAEAVDYGLLVEDGDVDVEYVYDFGSNSEWIMVY